MTGATLSGALFGTLELAVDGLEDLDRLSVLSTASCDSSASCEAFEGALRRDCGFEADAGIDRVGSAELVLLVRALVVTPGPSDWLVTLSERAFRVRGFVDEVGGRVEELAWSWAATLEAAAEGLDLVLGFALEVLGLDGSLGLGAEFWEADFLEVDLVTLDGLPRPRRSLSRDLGGELEVLDSER